MIKQKLIHYFVEEMLDPDVHSIVLNSSKMKLGT